MHRLLRDVVRSSDVVVDATVGNGWDTLFLSELVGSSGTVIGFDIQQIALDVARVRLGPDTQNVRLVLGGHERMTELIDRQYRGRIKAVTFNLGYLPGGEKSISTRVASTIAAINQALELIMPGGLVTIVCYSHPEGLIEGESVEKLVTGLSQDHFCSIRTQFVNQRGNPPVVFAVYSQSDHREIQ